MRYLMSDVVQPVLPIQTLFGTLDTAGLCFYQNTIDVAVGFEFREYDGWYTDMMQTPRKSAVRILIDGSREEENI